MVNVTIPLFATAGDTSLDYLTDYWHEANARWFRGKLTPVPIVVGLEKSRHAIGRYGWDQRNRQYQIEIRRNLLGKLDDPRRYWNATGVILHEMIHQYLQQHVDWRGLGHGDEFTAWCNKIGRDIGAPEVVTRKPRGRTVPLARYWPQYIYPAKAAVAT